MDLGVVEAWSGAARGYGQILHHPLQTTADWERLAATAAPGPQVAAGLAAIPLVRAGLEAPRPVLQTIMSPVSMAAQLAGWPELRRRLTNDPDVAHALLRRLTDLVRQIIATTEAAGASGIFYAIQQMRAGAFPAAEYRDLYAAYDRPCIEAAARMPLNLIHIHGADIHLPPHPLPETCWLHWELSERNPGLGEVSAALPAPLAVGLSADALVRLADTNRIRPFIDDLFGRSEGRPLMLTPGCTLPLGLPQAVIEKWLAVLGDRTELTATACTRAGAPAGPPRRKTLDGIITEAWADIVRPGCEHPFRQSLKLLLRLEQDLQRPLPLGVVDLAKGPAALAARVAALPRPPPPGFRSRRRQLFMLMEPEHPLSNAAGIVRALRDVADVRVLILDPGLWGAPRAVARTGFAASILRQLPRGAPHVALLGWGRYADVPAWLADAIPGSIAVAASLRIEPPETSSAEPSPIDEAHEMELAQLRPRRQPWTFPACDLPAATRADLWDPTWLAGFAAAFGEAFGEDGQTP